ncbi:MAG: hypothetical protein AUK01_11335 [Anaerolineae bacterium CG2_30_57_67]|nr:MAG: hypothetical protein AUK01_11335 [Anaerolineae bacterium CG2_30_57_67]
MLHNRARETKTEDVAMCLKPQMPRVMPVEMQYLGATLLAPDNPYRLVGEQLYERYQEADFADLYPDEGQPALSPVDLAFVGVAVNIRQVARWMAGIRPQ